MGFRRLNKSTFFELPSFHQQIQSVHIALRKYNIFMGFRIPPELIDQIIDHVPSDSGLKYQYELARLLRVSRLWCSLVQPKLYRSISITSNGVLLARTLKSNDRLAILVKELQIQPYCSLPRNQTEVGQTNTQICREILEMCPNVMGVVYRANRRDGECYLVRNALGNAKRLKRLRVVDAMDFFVGEEELLGTLGRWENIESLCLNGVSLSSRNRPGIGTSRTGNVTSQISCLNLRKLEVVGVELGENNLRTLSSVKAPIETFSISYLNTEFDGQEVLESLYSCLRNWSETLVKIHIEANEAVNLATSDFSFPSLPKVTHLYTRFAVDHPDNFRRIPKLASLYYGISPDEEHSTPEFLEALLEVLNSGSALNELTSLTLYRGCSIFFVTDHIQEVCLERNISFATRYN